MALFFFDTRDNHDFIQDDVGLELPDLEAVKSQAAASLAELAKDVLPSSLKRVLAVEVRDEKQPVLRAVLTFEAIILVAARKLGGSGSKISPTASTRKSPCRRRPGPTT